MPYAPVTGSCSSWLVMGSTGNAYSSRGRAHDATGTMAGAPVPHFGGAGGTRSRLRMAAASRAGRLVHEPGTALGLRHRALRSPRRAPAAQAQLLRSGELLQP